jgi:hypothetical protein
MECLQRGTIESDDEARTFFEQALAVDPQYARAQAGLSLSHFNECSCQAWDYSEQKEKLAYNCAQRADVFRKEGALWFVCFDHEVAHVPEVRGFRDIAQLLARPTEELHCVALSGQSAHTGRGVEVLDEQARRAYRARLRELEAEIAEAREANDPGRAARNEEEKERLSFRVRGGGGEDVDKKNWPIGVGCVLLSRDQERDQHC